MTHESSLLHDAYDGTALYGRVGQTISAVVFILLAIVMLAVGIYLLVTGNKYSHSVSAVSNGCEDAHKQDNVLNELYNCTYDYTVDGKSYTFKDTGSEDNKKGTKVTLYYDPKDPSEATFKRSHVKTIIGWILLGLSGFFVVFALVPLWLVYEYKPIAAYAGASAIVHDFLGNRNPPLNVPQAHLDLNTQPINLNPQPISTTFQNPLMNMNMGI